MEITVGFEGTSAAQTAGRFTLSGAIADEGTFEGWSNHDGTRSLQAQGREELYYGEKTLAGKGGRAVLVYSGITSDGGRTARGWFRISQGTGLYVRAEGTGEFELRCTEKTTVVQGRIAPVPAGEAW